MHFPVTDLPHPHSLDLFIIFPLSLSSNAHCYAMFSGTDHLLNNYPALLQFGSRLPTKNGPILSTSRLTFRCLEFIIQLTLRSGHVVKQTRTAPKLHRPFRLLSDQKFSLTISHLFQTKLKVERQKIWYNCHWSVADHRFTNHAAFDLVISATV